MSFSSNTHDVGSSGLGSGLFFLFLATIVSTVLFSEISGGNTFNFLVTAAFLAAAVGIALLSKRPIILFPEVGLLFLWLCIGIVPSLFALSVDVAVEKTTQVLQIVVLVFICANVGAWHNNMKPFLLTFAGAAVLSYVASLAGFTFGIVDDAALQEYTTGSRATGLASNANKFAPMMVYGQMCLLILASQTDRLKDRVLLGVMFAILTVAVIHSGSRMSLIGTLLLCTGSIFVFRLWSAKNLARLFLIGGLVLVVTGVLFLAVKDNPRIDASVQAFLSDERMKGRYENLIALVASKGDLESADRSQEKSVFRRAELAREAMLTPIRVAPFGVGLDNFKLYAGSYAHSNFLEILATTGFIGLAAYYAIFGCILLRLWRQADHATTESRSVLQLYALIIFVLAVMDTTIVTYYSKQFWLFFALLISSIAVRECESARQPISARPVAA